MASWSSRPSFLTVNHFIEMRVRQASSPTTIKNSVAALTTNDLLCMDRSCCCSIMPLLRKASRCKTLGHV